MKSRNLYLKYAKEAMKYTLGVIKFSSNQLEDQDSAVGIRVQQSLDHMRANVITFPEYSLGWIAEIARLAEEYQVGNCIEKSCVAFMYLKRKFEALSIQAQLELFNNPFQDHFFLVIGRGNNKDSHDPATWTGVSCDSWDKECYSVLSTAFKKSKIYSGILKSLTRDVLAKANEIQNQVIISQPRLVLRHTLLTCSNQKLDFSGINTSAPIAYEKWDFPKNKDRLKQQNMDEFRAEISKELSMLGLFKQPLIDDSTNSIENLIASYLNPGKKTL